MKGKSVLMKIELKEITIRDVVAGYVDSQEDWILDQNIKESLSTKISKEKR